MLERVITASGVDVLEVGDLIVNQPLPEKYSRLRNGLEIETAEAVDLAVGMAVGDGPYCRLSKEGRLRVETGWDGNMHLYMTSRLANDLTGLHGRELSLDWCTAAPEPVDAPRLVDAAADDRFWATVQAATKSVILLCERWAYGAYGCRWFRVTPENAAEIAYAVRPRSLLCVVADPDLRIEPALLDDDFTSFKAPLSPGELAYRAYPFGADDLSEVTAEGFSLMLRESELSKWCAVVPDSDGVVRGQWEDYGES
ncbi:hypothetical protein Pve01_63640 [Planomonospora venezuelensis]|nr:hypothetical protein Pve01_63640 [Planomonospora venezuelensis]